MKRYYFLLILTMATFGAKAQFSMNGVYTIDASQPAGANNFQSFTELANRLNTYGVIGPVTVNVKEDSYNERLKLEEILNSSQANTVTIQGDPSNANNPVLHHTARLDTGVVNLIDAANLVFKDLTLESTGTAGYTVRTMGDVTNLTFENVTLLNPVTGAPSSSGANIFAGGDFGQNGLTVVNCEIIGNRIGIQVTTPNTVDSKVSITGTKFTGFATDGVRVFYLKELEVHDCLFASTDLNSNPTVSIYGNFNSVEDVVISIIKNKIILPEGDRDGITIFSAKSANPEDFVVSNNVIQTNSAGQKRGMILPRLKRGVVEHNTVRFESTGEGDEFFPLILTAGGNQDSIVDLSVRNNLWFTKNRRGNSYLVQFNPNQSYYQIDFSNNLYYGTPSRCQWELGGFPTSSFFDNFSDWVNFSGETNSIFGDPDFYAPNDFHLESSLVNNQAISSAITTEDIDGDVRPLSGTGNADIGADEFEIPLCAVPHNFEEILSDTSSFTLEWSSTATEWAVIYGPPGFDPLTQGTRIETTSNPTQITGLNSNEYFDIYIRSLCSPDSSVLRGPIDANTLGLSKFLDYDFECGPGLFDMDTAQSLVISGENVLFTTPFQVKVADRIFTELSIHENGGVSLESVGTLDTSFYFDNGLYLFTQELEQDAFAANNVEGVFWDVFGTAPNRTFVIEWRHVGSSAPPPNAPGKVSFQMAFEEETGEIYYLYDDVFFGETTLDYGRRAAIGYYDFNEVAAISINESQFLQTHSCVHFYPTNCTKPQNLEVVETTSTSIEIAWDNLTGNTHAAIIYGLEGFDPATQGTLVDPATSPFQITGLNLDETYDFYLFSACSNGLMSDTNFIQATTERACGTPEDLSHFFVADSMRLYWDWSPESPQFLADSFNLTYAFIHESPDAGTTITIPYQLGDTIKEPWLSGGVYNMYVQAICGSSLSAQSIPITFRVPLTNDEPCDAINLPVDGATRIFNNFSASAQQAEGALEPNQTGFNQTDGWGVASIDNSVWYTFTPPTNGTRFDATQIEYDGQLAIYDVGVCSNWGTFTLVAANDNAVDSSSISPKMELCSLVPGRLYYLLFDSPAFEEYGNYSLNLSSLSANAGTVPIEDQVVCAGDSLNLFDYVVGHEQGGTWFDLFGSGSLTDSIVDTELMPDGEFDFRYLITDGCLRDSVKVDIINEHGALAGTGTEDVVCPSDPIFLFSLLTGQFSQSGTWYDYNGNFVINGTTQIPNPGTDYNFIYVVENVICPHDTAFVSIDVDPCGLGVDESELLTVKLFPNPANDEFTLAIDIDENVLIAVRDVQGKIVYTDEIQPLKETLKVDCSRWAKGFYQLEIRTNTFAKTLPFVKL